MPLAAHPRAIVTGAGSGLGRGFCVRLAARGARILAADINLAAAKETAAFLANGQSHAEVHAAHADVAQLADVEALASEAERLLGGVDLVINNAGVAVAGLVGEIPMSDWSWIMGVNLWGVIHGCHVFAPILRRQGSGHLLNTASAAGLLSAPRMGPYNVTKAGVIALSETLAGELAGSGVGCTVLCPTFFPTNIMRDSRGADPNAQAMVSKLMAKSKLSADDVAEVALQSAARNQLYCVPHADGRWLWRLKRAAPERFYSAMPKVIEARLKSSSAKA